MSIVRKEMIAKAIAITTPFLKEVAEQLGIAMEELKPPVNR